MRALLVQGRSPATYSSVEHALPSLGKAATYPPLGIATLAALLPTAWELRLRDPHVAPLDDADLAWADVVLVSGMLIYTEEVVLPRLDAAISRLDVAVAASGHGGARVEAVARGAGAPASSRSSVALPLSAAAHPS